MDREQIEKWRAEADKYASKVLPYSHLLSMHYRDLRDEHFARLVRAAALEEAAEYMEVNYRYYSIASGIRALAAKEPK